MANSQANSLGEAPLFLGHACLPGIFVKVRPSGKRFPVAGTSNRILASKGEK